MIELSPDIADRTVATGRLLQPLDLVSVATARTAIPVAEWRFLVKTKKVRLDFLILRIFKSLI